MPVSRIMGARGPHPGELDSAPLMSDWLIIWHPFGTTLVLLGSPLGYANAQYNLAHMYDNSRGVPQDFVTAHMWFNISSAKAYPLCSGST
jgi:TPR repeat protein